jgi:hypothetical protein
LVIIVEIVKRITTTRECSRREIRDNWIKKKRGLIIIIIIITTIIIVMFVVDYVIVNGINK